MKRKLSLIAAALGLAVLLNGCAPIGSLFALYKPDDKAFENGLVGVWKQVDTNSDDSEEKTRWIFHSSEEQNFYDVKLAAVGAKGGFLAKARLVRIGTSQFIDFAGDTDNKAMDSPDTLAPFPVMSVHMFGRVWLEGDTLEIHFLKDDWVKEQVKAGAFPLATLDVDGGPLLTAKTDELRKFMQEHADDKEALSDNYKFSREK
jgi:hypothetical protein